MTSKLAIFACVIATAAAADEGTLPLTYELFETAIAHADLEECPHSLRQQDTFCRATVHHDEVHVFVFSEDGDQPLIGFYSYPFEKLAGALN